MSDAGHTELTHGIATGKPRPRRMRRVFQRLIRPFIAWIMACLASGFGIALALGIVSTLDELGRGRNPADEIGAIIAVGAIAAYLVVILTALPWLVLAWVMYARGWQRRSTAMLLGGIMGAALFQLFGLPILQGPSGILMTTLLFGGGLIGGAVYRTIAGKPRL